ncbi:MAG: Clp1/GlmU family protein, partial [Myxococcota bacterium]
MRALTPLEDARKSMLDALRAGQRVMLIGPSGTGKSTLCKAAAQQLGEELGVVCADPGRPTFGPPGALTFGRLKVEAWELEAMCGVATLDSIRFRMLWLSALSELARARTGPMLFDMPGVWRGGAARELITGAARSLGVDLVVALIPSSDTNLHTPKGMWTELEMLPGALIVARPHPAAKRLGEGSRHAARTQTWNTFMTPGEVRSTHLTHTPILGATPPQVPEHWIGRQIAILGADGRTLGMGCVTGLIDHAPTADVRQVFPGEIAAARMHDARVVRGRLRTDRYVGEQD